LVASLALSSCGTGTAVADARASCVFVHKALVLQTRSEAAGVSSAEQATLQANALSELLKGTQLAADATSADGSWNPLETTVNEAERVPLANLVPALTRLCRVANSTSPYL
jgi:hypothetical protein